MHDYDLYFTFEDFDLFQQCFIGFFLNVASLHVSWHWMYFWVFWCYCKWNHFFIWNFSCLLQKSVQKIQNTKYRNTDCRKAVAFIYQPHIFMALLCLFISCRISLMILRNSLHVILPFNKRDSFSAYFIIWIYFISFYYLNKWIRLPIDVE